MGGQLRSWGESVQPAGRPPGRGEHQWAGVVASAGLEYGTGLGIKGRVGGAECHLPLEGTGNPKPLFLPLSSHWAHLLDLGPESPLLDGTAVVWAWDGAGVTAEHGTVGGNARKALSGWS